MLDVRFQHKLALNTQNILLLTLLMPPPLLAFSIATADGACLYSCLLCCVLLMLAAHEVSCCSRHSVTKAQSRLDLKQWRLEPNDLLLLLILLPLLLSPLLHTRL